MKGKMAYIGAGAGLVLYAIFGLMPGSFLGGVMGLNIAGSLFGYPVSSGVLSRIIVAVSMLTGIMVSGLIFVCGSALVGWVLGAAVDAITGGVKKPAEKASESIKK